MGSLYVGNLHPDCTEATLYQKFAPIGKLLNIHVCRDVETGRSLGYGFLNFERKEDADEALLTQNYEPVKGKVIRLMWATQKSLKPNVYANLFIKNIDPDIDEKTLYSIFADFGPISSLKITTDDNGKSRGFGFVQYENESDADKAIDNLNGKIVKGKPVYVTKFKPREKKGENFKNLYIKNFEPTWKDKDLEELCRKFGTIVSARVMTDENGESKGFGFVGFKDSASAKQAAQELNGTLLNGRKLYASRAKKKTERRAEIAENLKRKIELLPA